MKNFLETLSIRTLATREKTFGFGLLYTYVACLLVVVIGLFYFWSTLPAGFVGSVENTADTFLNEYPDELVLNLNKEGVLSKNIPGPLTFGSGLLEKISTEETRDFTSLIYLDDTQAASVQNLMDSHAFIFIGKDGIVGKNENKIEVSLFKDMVSAEDAPAFEGFALDKSKLVEFKNGAMEYLPRIIFIIGVMLIIFAPVILFGMHVIWSIIVTFVVWLILAVFKKKDFEESFLATIYAGVPAIFVGTLLSILGIPFLRNQTFLTVVFVCLAYFVFDKKSIKPVDATIPVKEV